LPGLPRILYIAPDIVLDLPGALSAALTGDYVAFWPKARAPDADQDRKRILAGFGTFGFHPAPISRLPFGLRQLRDLTYFVGMGALLAIRSGRYDAIVTYGPYRTALAGLVLRTLRAGRVLIVEMPMDPNRVYAFDGSQIGRLKHRISPGYARWMAGRADRLMILYERQLVDLGMPGTLPATVVPPFIRMRAVPSALEIRPTLLLIGKPLRLKGADVLLKAWGRIAGDFPRFSLCIAGSDEDLEPYQRLVHPGQRVEFRGRLDHTEVLELMASCYLFVLPSRTEGVPRVLVEAMGAGRPVVATAVGGIPSLVQDEVTGLLVPPEDDHALETALRRLLADPALATRLGEAGREHARHSFSEEHVAQQWRAAVDAALARFSAQTPAKA
jgi:glycosyltransferase involved in cell wall biosynthesis